MIELRCQDPRSRAEIERSELLARLARANERIGGLREMTDRFGNVVHFHMARRLGSLDELAVDLDARSREMPAAGTHGRRMFEQDLGSLEDEITLGVAELASATAEERGDARLEMRADIRLLQVNAETGERWWRRMFGRGRTGPVAADPGHEVRAASTDEGGGAPGTTS